MIVALFSEIYFSHDLVCPMKNRIPHSGVIKIEKHQIYKHCRDLLWRDGAERVEVHALRAGTRNRSIERIDDFNGEHGHEMFEHINRPAFHPNILKPIRIFND